MADTVTTILTILLWFMGIGITGTIILIVWLNSKYKHRVKIRKIVKGRSIIIEDRARDLIDQWKTPWWKLRKLKTKIPVPPSECVDITNKGKLTAEFYLTEDGAYIPIKDDFDLDKMRKVGAEALRKKARVDEAISIHEEILKLKPGDRTDKQKEFLKNFNDRLEEFTKDEIEAVEFLSEFKPLTTQERALMVAEHSKALDYKTKKSWTEVAQALIMYGAPVILIAVILIFIPEILQSFGELVDKLGSVADNLDNAVQRLGDVEQGVINLPTEPTAPPN